MSEPGCPHCGSELVSGRSYCGRCGRRAVDFDHCSECDEPLSMHAKYCPHCGQRVRRFRRTRESEAPPLDLHVRAKRLGAFLGSGSIAALLRPPVIHATAERVMIQHSNWLGLGRDLLQVEVDQITSIRSVDGVFGGELVLEIEDRPPGEEIIVRGFRRADARNVAFQVESLLRR